MSRAPTGEREYFSSEVPGLCLESEISVQPVNGRVFPYRKHRFHPAIHRQSRDFASMNPSHPQPRHTDHLASQDRKSYRSRSAEVAVPVEPATAVDVHLLAEERSQAMENVAGGHAFASNSTIVQPGQELHRVGQPRSAIEQ